MAGRPSRRALVDRAWLSLLLGFSTQIPWIVTRGGVPSYVMERSAPPAVVRKLPARSLAPNVPDGAMVTVPSEYGATGIVHVVPEQVIRRMAEQLKKEPPGGTEGFNLIELVDPGSHR